MSTGLRRRIVVLWHERDQGVTDGYMITHLTPYWRAEGIEVEFLFGTRKFVPADVAIVHVDLSVVPDEYLALARRYPVAVNGRVRSIRRSTYSRQLLRPGDRWDGPVIVKSALNYGGWPEWHLRRRGATGRRVAWNVLSRLRLAPRPASYRVYSGLAEVPASCFTAPNTVVEKFLPEREGELYAVRYYYFLGDRWTCERLLSPSPVVKRQSQVRLEAIEPHPAVQEWPAQLGIDYGKLDYVVRDGRPILLDVNKTTAAGEPSTTPGLEALRRERAAGIHAYFRRCEETRSGAEWA